MSVRFSCNLTSQLSRGDVSPYTGRKKKKKALLIDEKFIVHFIIANKWQETKLIKCETLN